MARSNMEEQSKTEFNRDQLNKFSSRKKWKSQTMWSCVRTTGFIYTELSRCSAMNVEECIMNFFKQNGTLLTSFSFSLQTL